MGYFKQNKTLAHTLCFNFKTTLLIIKVQLYY